MSEMNTDAGALGESANGIELETGAKKTIGWEDRHADRYYEEVRKRKPYSDARHIAPRTRYNVEQIEEIRQHVFIKKHMRDGREIRFDADYDQAQAWQRLSTGQSVWDSDMIWLEHEYFELTLMRENGYTYDQAHVITNQTYNWHERVEEEKSRRALKRPSKE